jgi:hypothetical protein
MIFSKKNHDFFDSLDFMKHMRVKIQYSLASLWFQFSIKAKKPHCRYYMINNINWRHLILVKNWRKSTKVLLLSST